MNTEQLVEALFPKRNGGDIATHEDELAALDSSSITPCRGSYHRCREINACDAPLVCLRQCECESTSSTKANFKDPIGWLDVQQSNTPLSLRRMLAAHTFTNDLPDQTSRIAMLLIDICCPLCA
jgi:hypothetical protein